MGRGQDQYTLRKQLGVLDARLQALRVNGGRKKREIDAEALKTLRELSPLELSPCLIQRRRNEGYVAANLIQKVGDTSWRFLVRSERWRISRAQRGTQVLRLHPALGELFDQVISMQETYSAGLAGLLKVVQEHAERKPRR
jgi:hypothetical protein